MREPRLSIIVPSLNEAAHIAATLAPLQAMRARGVEVIVADGGSNDETKTLAQPLADRVIDAPRGRARQMNAGAKASTGNVLLFLHADSRLSPNAGNDIAIATQRGARWGRFDVSITGTSAMFPVIAWFINHRSRWSGIATGDQGLFVARDVFDALGGFPDQPLMEDIEFCKRAKRFGAPACLDVRIETSGRRWEKHGVFNTIVLMWALRARYFFGEAPESLHRAYYGKAAP
ncbi:MAG: TIGR04283 family arsenosugar biosynthesis glycosyltransferase [Betaproteobacteria bacterium]|nr:TIGR04283 family arsenosugar biosynthesis glycosyltransferase [Betaproteobacteria bacterium]